MRLVILGAPGAGKGTQAARIAKRLGISHLSTGEMLRAAVKAQTEIGRQAEAVMESGALVSDGLVLKLIAERLGEDARSGFILDGFPRTLAQAKALDELLGEGQIALDAVLEIRVDEALLIGRIETRTRETAARGEPIRKDDNPETLRRRLRAYAEETMPLVDYYREKNLLRSVNGMEAIDSISRQLLQIIGA
jgi:adenylate kinase